MLLHNKIEKISKINDVRIEKLYFWSLTTTTFTFNKDENNWSSNPNKILFTDYAVARTASETTNWKPFNISPNTFATIKYLDNEYTISSAYSEVLYELSGGTGITNRTMFNYSGNTYFKNDANFYLRSSEKDYVLVSILDDSSANFDSYEIISTNSKFNYFTTIKEINSNYVVIDEIPGFIYDDFKSYKFRIRNLHFCSATTSDFERYLNLSPYARVINFTNLYYNNLIRLETNESWNSKTSDYFRYFDYDLFTITTNDYVPMMNPPSDQTFCANSTSVIGPFSSNDPNATYYWTCDNTNISTTPLTLTPTGNGDTITFTSKNWTNTTATANFTVTPSFNGITGIPETFVVNIEVVPQVNTQIDLYLNPNILTSDIIFTSTNNSIIKWNINSSYNIGINTTNGLTSIPAFTTINNYHQQLSNTVTLTPQNGTCFGTPKTFNIYVNPIAQVNQITNYSYCEGVSTSIITFTTNNIDGVTTYTWYNNKPSINLGASGTGNIPSFSTLNPTSAIIDAIITVIPTYTKNGVQNVGSPMTFTISVKKKTVPIFSSSIFSALYCQGTTITLPTTSNNGIVGVWSSINVVSVFTPQTVTFTPTTPCATNYTNTITITQKKTPVFTSTIPVRTFCYASSSYTLPNISDSPDSITGYWSPFSVDRSIVGNSVYTFYPSNNQTICSNTASVTFTIIPEPILTFYPLGTTAFGAFTPTCTVPCTIATCTVTNQPMAASFLQWTNETINNYNFQYDSGTGKMSVILDTTRINDVYCDNICTLVGYSRSLPTNITISGCDISVYNTTHNVIAMSLSSGKLRFITSTNWTSAPFPNMGNTTLKMSSWSNTIIFSYRNIFIKTSTPVIYSPSFTTNTVPSIGIDSIYSGSFDNTLKSLVEYNPRNLTNSLAIGTLEITQSNTINGVTCSATIPSKLTITVIPTPQVDFILDQSLEVGSNTTAINFTTVNYGVTTTYSWTNNDTSIGLAANGVGDIPIFTPTNTTPSNKIATITVTPSITYDGVTHTGLPRTFQITVLTNIYLEMGFNTPIGYYTYSITQWNTFFNTSTMSDSPFIGIPEVVYDTQYGFYKVKLYGGKNLKISGLGIGSQSKFNTTLVSIKGKHVTEVRDYAFSGLFYLKTAEFPNCVSIGIKSFQVTRLGSVYFPLCTSLGLGAFYTCQYLTYVNLPLVTDIPTDCFYKGGFQMNYSGTNPNENLKVYINRVANIGLNAFTYCTHLTHLEICRLDSVTTTISVPFLSLIIDRTGINILTVRSKLKGPGGWADITNCEQSSNIFDDFLLPAHNNTIVWGSPPCGCDAVIDIPGGIS